MNVWFTSDWHFGHKNIMTYCPDRVEFLKMRNPGDVSEMNERLVLLWNLQVEPDDEVNFLGDFGMGRIEDSLSYVQRLNGTKHLYWGNHDRPHYCNFKRSEHDEWKPEKFQKHLDWVQRYGDAGFKTQRLDGFHDFGDGVTAQLSHFPYTGDSEHEDRYQEYRPEDNGFALVHGHIHDLWQVNGRQINVGVDAWGRLLHESEVKQLVEGVFK